MNTTDESYDVPWEFNKNNRNLTRLANGRVSGEQICFKSKKDQPTTNENNAKCTCRQLNSSYDNNVKSTPPCGVKAKEIKNKHQNFTSPEQKTDNYIVWKYRGPDTDGRPSSDYDPPWDIRSASTSNSKNDVVVEPKNAFKTTQNDTIESKNSADSGVYDEPWDKNSSNCRLATKIINGTKNGFDGECSSSPCTSRSASSQGSVSVSSGSRETLNNSSSVNQKNNFNKKVQTNEASTNTTRKTTKTPPVLETAFCAKTNKNSSMDENLRLQDVRDRLIQQLCNGTTTMDVVNKIVQTTSTPVPAVRRSKLKSLEEVSPNERRDVVVVDERRSIDNVPLLINNRSPIDNKSITTKNIIADDQPGETATTTAVDVYDIPWEFSNGSKLDRLKNHLNRRSSGEINDESAEKRTTSTPSKKLLNLNRQHLQLNFGCAGLNPTSEKIDAALSLDLQPWYHGNITRAEAEQRLRSCKEGSYLVRVCESAQCQKHEEYALSLKSAKGFMHMKIQLNVDKKWILGYFSHPFESISKMIRYYSVNKLPIKGAEHMCLIQPIADQVL